MQHKVAGIVATSGPVEVWRRARRSILWKSYTKRPPIYKAMYNFRTSSKSIPKPERLTVAI